MKFTETLEEEYKLLTEMCDCMKKKKLKETDDGEFECKCKDKKDCKCKDKKKEKADDEA